MKLVSPAFQNNGYIPALYSCDDQGINPPLTITDVPKDAKNLVLIVDDPDAPMGTFTHWIVWNIPPDAEEITEEMLPQEAVEGKNSTGEVGWTAPCPPQGTHHYRFMVFALSKKLNLPEGADRDTLEKEIEDAVIDKTELVGLYQRG